MAKLTEFTKVIVPKIPEVSIGEYNGHKLIVLKRSADDTFPFQFGVSKAILITECFPELKSNPVMQKFITENQTDKE